MQARLRAATTAAALALPLACGVGFAAPAHAADANDICAALGWAPGRWR